MIADCTADVISRRRMPEAWPELIAPIEAAPDSVEAAKQVWERVGKLQGDEFDQNRYYSLGSALCCYARTIKPVLTNPVQRQELVKEGAQKILEKREIMDPTWAIQLVLEPTMEAALAGRSTPERIVDDSLAVHSYLRRTQHTSLPRENCFDDHILKSLRSGESYLANAMKAKALGAVTLLDNIVFKAKLAGTGTALLQDLPTEREIALLRTPHTLKWLKQLAARVPVAHFSTVAARTILFDVASDGTQKLRDIDWELEQVAMDKDAEKLCGKTRTTKLMCPALNVTGLIDDSVALSIDMLDAARQMED